MVNYPCKKKERELGCDLKFIGLRALESRSRVRLWADYGDMYTVKEYYGKKKPIIKCTTIATWSEKDIWDYVHINNIPICELYNKGYERNGCWTCAMAIRNGQLKRLKRYNQKLYYHLIHETEMGQEIIRLSNLLKSNIKYRNYIKLPSY